MPEPEPSPLEPTPLEKKLGELFAQGPEGRVRVLEVACGTGGPTRTVIRALARHRPEASFVTFDRDPRMAAGARRLCAGAPEGAKPSWLCCDLYALPLAEASFDYIVALNIFHGVDRRRFSEQMHRVLRPDGRILICDRAPQLLQVQLFSLILDRTQLGALRQLPPRAGL